MEDGKLMDYSVYYPSVLARYFESLIAGIFMMPFLLGIFIFSIVYIIKNKKIIETVSISEVEGGEIVEKKIKYIHNYDSVISIILVVVCPILFVLSLSNAFNLISDFPHAMNRNFTITTGIVTSWSTADERTYHRVIEIKDINTDEIIKISVWDYPIHKDEILEVIYLPNSGEGAIIRRIDPDEFERTDKEILN